MKAIIIAYACDPDLGSEEGVGFNYYRIKERLKERSLHSKEKSRKILLLFDSVNIRRWEW